MSIGQVLTQCTLSPVNGEDARSLLLPTAGSFIEVQDRLISPVWHDNTNNKILDDAPSSTVKTLTSGFELALCLPPLPAAPLPANDHFSTCGRCLLPAGMLDSRAYRRLAGLNFKEACRDRKLEDSLKPKVRTR
ncbi:hypothetical protein ONE63_002206 [Megalurothrips usitatus]|uniref:Uncharacterized protein n=1 Tax=Megalurothrips usitatus TaxID=439358 RepID=A0AAV7XDH6_9NEOP|nr:hypothetical protein ONE63_002206 [Megalurothrips usitatus]